MAALAEIVGTDTQTFMGLRLPLTVRFSEPLTNETLMQLSRQHRPYRMERNDAGELEIMSPLNPQGGEWEAYVIMELGIWNRVHDGHVFSSNSGFSLPGGAVRSPDASWISESGWSKVSQEERETFSNICPQFLVEILSKSDSKKVLQEKMQMWVEKGAELAWMIDPFAADVHIYQPGRPTKVLIRPESVEAASVVEGFRLDMKNLWAK